MNSSFTYYSKKVVETLDSIGTDSTQENQNISLTKEEQAQLGLLKTAWKYLEKAIRYIGLGNLLDWLKSLSIWIKRAFKIFFGSGIALILGWFALKLLERFNIGISLVGRILLQFSIFWDNLYYFFVKGLFPWVFQYYHIFLIITLIYLIWRFFRSLKKTKSDDIVSLLDFNNNSKQTNDLVFLNLNENKSEGALSLVPTIKIDNLKNIFLDHKEFMLLGILGFLTIVGYYFTPKRRNPLLQLSTQQQQQQANNNNLQVIQPLEVRIRNMANGNSVEYHDPQTGNLRSTQDLRDTLGIIVNYARNHPNSGFNPAEYLCAGTIRIFGPNNRFLRFDRDFHDQPSLENLDETSNNLLDPLMNSLNSIELQLANEENKNDEEAILQLQSQRDTLRDQILDNSLSGSFVLDIHVDNNQEFQEIANAENALRETNLAAQQIVAESDESNLSGLNQNLNYGILFNQAIKAAIKDKEHENKHYWNFGLFKVKKLSSNLPRKPRSDSLIGLYADLYQSRSNSRKGSIDLNDSSNLANEDDDVQDTVQSQLFGNNNDTVRNFKHGITRVKDNIQENKNKYAQQAQIYKENVKRAVKIPAYGISAQENAKEAYKAQENQQNEQKKLNVAVDMAKSSLLLDDED